MAWRETVLLLVNFKYLPLVSERDNDSGPYLGILSVGGVRLSWV